MLYSSLQNDSDNSIASIIDYLSFDLLNNFEDNSIRKTIADIIFNRNDKNEYIHDIVWTYFKKINNEGIKNISEHLNTDNNDEFKLACNLLHYKPYKHNGIINEKKICYKKYLEWLRENADFLYPNEKAYLYSSDPITFNINYLKKYLLSYYKSPNSKIQKLTNSYNSLEKSDKEVLAHYSYELYNKNKSNWSEWINKPINNQLEISYRENEG